MSVHAVKVIEKPQVDFSQFEDEFGNLKEEYEIIRYSKLADGKWVEDGRFESSRNYYVIDGKVYYRNWGNHQKLGTLSELNMDFDSPTCGACYQVGKVLEGQRKITGNEILVTCVSTTGETLTLKKQSYSDGTCFFTTERSRGGLDYGRHLLTDIILELEAERDRMSIKMKEWSTDEGLLETFQNLINWYEDFIVKAKECQ